MLGGGGLCGGLLDKGHRTTSTARRFLSVSPDRVFALDPGKKDLVYARPSKGVRPWPDHLLEPGAGAQLKLPPAAV
jgi:hypothetical protein